MDDEHAAPAVAPAVDEEARHPLARLVAREAVEVDVALHRVLAGAQPAQDAAVDAGGEPLDVLVGVGDVERPVAAAEVGELRQHLGVVGRTGHAPLPGRHRGRADAAARLPDRRRSRDLGQEEVLIALGGFLSARDGSGNRRGSGPHLQLGLRGLLELLQHSER